MTTSAPSSTLPLLALTLVLSASTATDSHAQETAEEAMLVQYLEIVTPDVDATCAAMEQTHGVSFGEAIPEFGNARTAELKGGGRIGVRAPMADHEDPVVRPYALVEDIESAVKEAEAAGAMIALPPTEIPGHGKYAVYILGGIQHGFWQH